MSSGLLAFQNALPISLFSRRPCIPNVSPRRNVERRPVSYTPSRHAPIARVRRGPKPTPVIPASLYDADPVPDVDLKPFDFSTLRDRVVLIVNVASEDDYAESNYKSFAELLEQYQAGGFEVVVFPSNWYGQRETRTHEEIKEHIHTTYSDRIHIMAKNSIEWNQLFALGRHYFPGEIVWNFHGKFLFGRKGLPVARFDLLTTHEYLESQVGHFVNNSDPSIHMVPPPNRDVIDLDDDWEAIHLREMEAELAAEEDDADYEDDLDDEESEQDTESDIEPDAESDGEQDVISNKASAAKTEEESLEGLEEVLEEGNEPTEVEEEGKESDDESEEVSTKQA